MGDTLEDPNPPLVLNYARPLGSRRARWARRVMLAVAILSILLAAALLINPVFSVSPIQEIFGGGVIGTPFSPIDGSMKQEEIQRQYVPRALLYLGLFLLTQWFFLSPRGSWRIAQSDDGPPPRRAAIAAGFIGMLLAVGLLATLMEIPDWWVRWTAPTLEASGDFHVRGGRQHFATVWVVMAILWIGWSVLFFTYWKSLDRYTALSRIVRWLIAGTVLELVVAAPVHAWVVQTRDGDCYCARGSWTGIAFGCTAALWLFGPGAFLLAWREKRRFETVVPPQPPRQT